MEAPGMMHENQEDERRELPAILPVGARWRRLALVAHHSCGWPARARGGRAHRTCHGLQSFSTPELRRLPRSGWKGGAAIALADPVYLAIADDATILRVTADGVPGTSMPAFAQPAGGMLTDAQIEVIVARNPKPLG